MEIVPLQSESKITEQFGFGYRFVETENDSDL